MNHQKIHQGSIMINIKHKFLDHTINPKTEILIIGTFNQNTEGNEADFFYGRVRNHLWNLLPRAYNEKDLKGAAKQEKLDFIEKHRIDFIDLIAKVKVDEGQEDNVNDHYIDHRVDEWRDVISEMKKLPTLKKVCLTRKSFADVPNIKVKVLEIQEYCQQENIPFQILSTPARFYNLTKQAEWTSFLLGS